MRDKNTSSSVSDRLFQVLLVILGLLLGVGSTYFWQMRQDKANTSAAVALLRVGARNEVSAINDEMAVVRRLKDPSDKDAAKSVRAALMGSPHDPVTYLPALKDLGVLEPLVIGSIDRYVRELRQCQNTREKLLGRLESGNKQGDVTAYAEDHVRSLDRLRIFSDGLLDYLDKYYPETF